MAIPDATGGDDKTLSDVGDNAGQAFKLPDALRTEAHADILPLVAPKPDVLPQITLTQPTDSGVTQIDAPPQLQVSEVSPKPAPSLPQVAMSDTGTTQVGVPVATDASAATPRAQAAEQRAAAPPPLQFAEVNPNLAPSIPQVALKPDTGIPQGGVASAATDASAATPKAQAAEQRAAAPPPLQFAEVNPKPAPLAPQVAMSDTGTTQVGVPVATDASAATPRAQAAEQRAAAPPPLQFAEVNPNLAPSIPQVALKPDTGIPQGGVASAATDASAATPKAQAAEQRAAAPPPLQFAEVNPNPAPLAPQVAAKSDTGIPQGGVAPVAADASAATPRAQAAEQRVVAPPPLQFAEVNPNPAPLAPQVAAKSDTGIPPGVASAATDASAATPRAQAAEQRAAAPPPLQFAEVNPNPAPLAPQVAAKSDTGIPPGVASAATDASAATPRAQAAEQRAAAPPPLQFAEVNPNPAPLAPQVAAKSDTGIPPGVASAATDASAATPRAQAAEQRAAAPPPLQFAEVNPKPALSASQVVINSDRGVPQTGATATPLPTISATIASAQSDTSTPGKVLDKLASAATQPQQVGYAVGPAAPKTESSETSGITPTPRIHTSSQFAVTREATQNITAGMQSYAAATASQDSKAQHASSIEKEVRTAALQPGAFPPGALPPGALPPSAFPPSTQPGIPGTKEVAVPQRSNDPQSLLAAMENAASRKVIGSVGTGETAPPQGKPATASLSGAQIADVSSIKQQDATSGPIIRTDVHGRILPPTATTGEVHTTQAAATPGAMPPLEGRVAQNVVQPGQHGIAPDSKSGTADTRKGLEVNPTTPGVVGQGVSTGKEHDDTKRILDVPNLNLDDKTQHTGEKGKTHVADQSNTDGSTPTQTKAETELANLFDRAKKDKKEQPEEADNIDTAAAAQQWVNTKRLEHKLRKGETLDLVSRKYFGDDMASTLIVELNPLVLNPRMHEHRVIISLPANSIIVIPFPNEVERFRKQLVAGTRTRMNIVYE